MPSIDAAALERTFRESSGRAVATLETRGAATAVAADADRNARRVGLLLRGTSLLSMPRTNSASISQSSVSAELVVFGTPGGGLRCLTAVVGAAQERQDSAGLAGRGVVHRLLRAGLGTMRRVVMCIGGCFFSTTRMDTTGHASALR